MRMVSKKNFSQRAKLITLGFLVAGTALAVSPAFGPIDAQIAKLKKAKVDCTKEDQNRQNDPKAAEDCNKCKDAVDEQKGSAPGKVTQAKAKDGSIEATAGAKSAAAGAGSAKTERGAMGSDQSNKSAGKEAKTQQAQNFADLAKALNECKQKIDEACQASGKGEDAKSACEQAAQQAQQASAQSAGDAQKMAQDEKKDDKNGQGMQPPQMPQMPQQQDKPKESGVASNTATSTAVGASSLSGNQLANQKVGIGGDSKSTDTAASTSTGYGGRNFGASGISTGNDPKFNGAGDFGGGKGGSPFNSSGASAMGGGFGGSGSEGGGKGAEAQAAAAAAQKQEDLDAYSNGGARPSYLGMKSKGSELSDLGLDAAAGTAPAADVGAGDRNVASTEQGANAGIGGEDGGGGSVFNMIHERLQEVGRRGSI